MLCSVLIEASRHSRPRGRRDLSPQSATKAPEAPQADQPALPPSPPPAWVPGERLPLGLSLP